MAKVDGTTRAKGTARVADTTSGGAEARRVKADVRAGYARIARHEACGCGAGSSCCGGTATAGAARDVSRSVGYTAADQESVPAGADLGLGCGNPTALAALTPGQTVLDLGAGGGFDCFLAAHRVGPAGRVIGVDMTAEMVALARDNAARGGVANVEFRQGEIEELPVEDGSVDVVISNCVINLSPDKPRVFGEAFRVLRPGGRLMVSDIVLLGGLPDEVKRSVAAYVGCLAGAMPRDEYLDAIRAAGFERVEVLSERHFPVECMLSDPTAQAVMSDLAMTPARAKEVARLVASVAVRARKPR